MTMQLRTKTLATLLALLVPGTALADRIDGAWCAPDGTQRVTIAGPEITLGSGQVVTGQYTRHEFLYRVPEEAPDAGAEIYMRQLGEEDVDIYRDTDPPVRWHRCQAVVS
ncbi:MAG: hypothetical protein KDK28_13510 [Maritimibacter sp.]|nr:hypothetical protein [Maritimibacter sp.]